MLQSLFKSPNKGLAKLAIVGLVAGTLASCNEPDTNYINYKNFADDHSIDYHKVLEKQIQKDNKKIQKEKRRKMRRYLENFYVE